MSIKKLALLSLLLLVLMTPVKAKPVRVLFLKFVFTGAYTPTSIKNGTPAFEAMLRDPASLTGGASLVNSTLGTGDSIVIPRMGFKSIPWGTEMLQMPSQLPGS